MTVLKIDYDRVRMPRIEWLLQKLCEILDWRIDAYMVHRTRRGWHLGISVRGRVTPDRVVAAQAILGSDPIREIYNLQRTATLKRLPRPQRAIAATRWNVLYEEHIHA